MLVGRDEFIHEQIRIHLRLRAPKKESKSQKPFSTLCDGSGYIGRSPSAQAISFSIQLNQQSAPFAVCRLPLARTRSRARAPNVKTKHS